jgi:hypothetical protein
MTRLCERPGCSERGAIAYGFDAERLLVWLLPLDPAADRNRSGVLCLRHADAMVVPVGWSLDDARDPTPRLFRAPAAPKRPPRPRRTPSKPEPSPAPSSTSGEQLELVERSRTAPATPAVEPVVIDVVDRTVASVTGVASATEEDPDATSAIPWMPEFDESDDLGGLLDARSPLLARAFWGADRQR